MFGLLTDDWPTFAFGVLAWFVAFIALDAARYFYQVFHLGNTNVKPYSLEDLGRVVLTGAVLFVVFPALYHLAPWVVFALATAIPAFGWRRIVAKLTDRDFLAGALQKAGKLNRSPQSKAIFDLTSTALNGGGLPGAGKPMRPLRRKSKRPPAMPK